MSTSAIDRWRQTGRLRTVYPRVYALGHAVLVPDGRRLSAVLACGPTAHLAVDDAGAVHSICSSSGTRFWVVVSTDRARVGPRPGIRVISARLTPDDVTVVRGIPVTSAARTIVDIAARRPARAEEVIDAAMEVGLYDQRAIDRQLVTGRRGVGVIRRALAERHPDAHDTKSSWEAAMLRMLDVHGLPRPKVNPPLLDLGIVPDLLWPHARLVVEWDSWRYHRSRSRFESDRRKSAVLHSAGYTVLRFTWRQTQREPEVVIGAIRIALRGRDGREAR